MTSETTYKTDITPRNRKKRKKKKALYLRVRKAPVSLMFLKGEEVYRMVVDAFTERLGR